MTGWAAHVYAACQVSCRKPPMGHAALKLPRTGAEFLVWDESQTVKHEFIHGEVVPWGGSGGSGGSSDILGRAGAGDAHVTAAGNVYMQLRQHLAGSPCRTFINDMKLQVDAVDAFFYPDVMVTRSAADAANRLVKREPMLIVEVLSPGTAAYDRGDKFAAYRTLPSLQEYLPVDAKTRCCDLDRKGADGLWVLHPSEAGQGVGLASVALEVSAEAL